MNVASLFLRNSGSIAFSEIRGDGSVTVRAHNALLAEVSDVCRSLRRSGIDAGDRVMTLTDSRLATLETVLAAFSLGAAAVPVDPYMAPKQLATLVQSMRPRCCVVDNALHADVREALQSCATELIAADRFGRAAAVGGTSGRRASPDSLDPQLAFTDCPGSLPALIVHTSGSQGTPKAIHLSHERLSTFFALHDYLYSQFPDSEPSAPPTSPIVSVLPLTHLGGLAISLQGLMSQRATYCLSRFEPGQFLQLIAQIRCTVIMLVPSMYRALLKESSLARTDLSALRFCITMGEPCSAALAERIEAALGTLVASTYGLTEAVAGIGHARSNLIHGRAKRGSCGTQLFGEVRLIDEQGRDHPQFGELCVRNGSVAPCYLDPALNEGRFLGPWLRTRDLFYKDEDGFFFHRGRCDDMFICNGKNIYPAELEMALMQNSAVDYVCAAPVVSLEEGTIPAVLVSLRSPVTEAEIRLYSARNAPRHAIPRLVQIVDDFPLLGPGKIDRARAARLLQKAYDERAPGVSTLPR